MQLSRRSSNGVSIYIGMFVIFLIVSNLMVSTISPYIPDVIYSTIKYICIGIVLFKIIFLTKYTLKELIIIILIVSVISLSAYEARTNTLLFGTVFIIGAKNVPFEKIVKAFFYTSLILVLGMFLLSIIGVIPNDIYYRESIPRYSFGSNYPTDFGAHIFYLLAAFAYLRRKKYGYVDFLLSLGTALFIWKFCDARLDVGLIIILSIGLLIISKRELNFKRFFDSCFTILPLSYLLSSFLIILFTIRYNVSSTFYTKMDSWLSQRLSIGHLGFDAYGMKLFGQAIQQHGWGGMTGAVSGYVYFFLDSSFIQLLLSYGIIVAVIFVSAFTYVGFKRMNDQELVLVLILSVIAISGIVDQHIIDLAFNPFLYIFWDSSFNSSENDLKRGIWRQYSAEKIN